MGGDKRDELMKWADAWHEKPARAEGHRRKSRADAKSSRRER